MNATLKIVLPIALLALGFGGRAWLLATGPQMPPPTPAHAVPAVEVLTVLTESRALTVECLAEMQPRVSVALAAEVGGRVLWVAPELEVGASFAAGAELLRLDPTDATQRLAAATAEVARARASLAMEEAAAESALADWRELGVGEASPLARREPQVALARATLAAAEAAAAAAATALQRCTVRAPLHGRTARRQVESGAVIAPGAPLATLHSAREHEARLPLTQADLAALGLEPPGPREPLPVEFRAAAGDVERTWRGWLVALEPALDPRDRTAFAVARLELPDGEQPPPAGTFVQAVARGRSVANVVELPRSALRAEDVVLLVDADDRLRLRDVGVVQRSRETVLVRGLADGERVCVLPPAIVVEGMRVAIAAAR